MPEATQRFTTTPRRQAGAILVDLPFDPARTWGKRSRYHITGTVGGVKVRGPLQADDDGFVLRLGPAWVRDCGIAPDAEVEVVLSPEGPQQETLADDLTRALDAEPAARDFFDSLATFYRKAYLSWVDATKRNPEERARRIAELIELLKAGKKQR
jgi:hypothetical protein